MERPYPQTRLRLAVNTQTPLVRLRNDSLMSAPRLHLDDLLPDTDYKFTAGGVTRMLQPLLRRGLANGQYTKAEWVALAGEESHPQIQTPDGFLLSYVGMPAEERAGYARLKEHLWALLNSMPPPADEPSTADWRAFEAHQERSARAVEQAIGRMGGTDVVYIHDFQQMGVGGRVDAPAHAPRVFHLHTPFPSTLPQEWAAAVVDRLHEYDAVICSTDRYATNLRNAGLRTPIQVIPPFIDPTEYKEASDEDVRAFRQRFEIAPTDKIILNIGRMDPMKGQDRLIRAMPRVLEEAPDARLVLVGNGSFSSSKRGGLGLSKGAAWRAACEELAEDLGVTDRVTFTGHLEDAAVPSALRACEVFVLPSTREGFGLAVVEAWRQRKPTIVSDRAGISDMIDDGSNGRLLDCGDSERLARALVELLHDPERAQAMGEAGFHTSHAATLPAGDQALRQLFAKLQEAKSVATR